MRKRAATRRSLRKMRWKSSGGRMFHEMVSVMAVKIQLSWPFMVARSVTVPVGVKDGGKKEAIQVGNGAMSVVGNVLKNENAASVVRLVNITASQG